ncbi:hypothetical protein COOONC_13222 [Cooperia oncophora]
MSVKKMRLKRATNSRISDFISLIKESTLQLLDAQDVREKMRLKRATNSRISDFISLIKESTLRMSNDADKKVKITPANVPCAQPRRQLLRVTRYWPLRSDQSFIYNVPKVCACLQLYKKGSSVA